MNHHVSPTEDGVLGVTVSVTEDGVERALTGAGGTRGAGATDAARALLRVSGGLGGPGGAGTRGCCCGGPGGNGTRGCCVMWLLLYSLMTIELCIAICFDIFASVLYDALIV